MFTARALKTFGLAVALIFVATGPSHADGARDAVLKAAFVKAVTTAGGPSVKFGNDFVVGPLVTAANTEGDATAKTKAWVMAMGQKGLSVAVPEYGFVMKGGKIFMGATNYTIQSMIAAADDQQVKAILGGKGHGGLLEGIDNPFIYTPFVDMPKAKKKGITEDNLGRTVQSQQELEKLWDDYRLYHRHQLSGIFGNRNTEDVLNRVWPRVLAMWKAQRAQHLAEQTAMKLQIAMTRAQQEVDAKPLPQSPRPPAPWWYGKWPFPQQAPPAPATAAPKVSTAPPNYGPPGRDFCCDYIHPYYKKQTCDPMNQPSRCTAFGGKVMYNGYCSTITSHCTPNGQ